MQKIYELPKALVPLVFLSLFLVYSCDSGGSSEIVCSFNEMQERFANTDCIGQEMVEGCSNIGCDTTGVKEIDLFRLNERCIIIDCETLQCDFRVDSEFEEGFVSISGLDLINGFPIGTFILGEIEEPFDCTVFVQ